MNIKTIILNSKYKKSENFYRPTRVNNKIKVNRDTET